jgi:acyl-coenzyme A thioesterase PaaI-like protein
MDLTQLPFNQLIGLETVDEGSGFLVSLPDDAKYSNHLGTVHASALLAVAEAGSGAFLIQQLGKGAGFVPVVRRIEAKFRKPATGRIAALATVEPSEVGRWKSDLASRGRLIASVPIDVIDDAGVTALSATVEWFIAREASD